MLASLYQLKNSGAPPLRIGLLLDTVALERCFAEVIQHILQSGFARIDLVVLNANEQRQSDEQQIHRSLPVKLYNILRDERKRKALIYTLYTRWDSRHIDEVEDPFGIVDCSELISGIDQLPVVPLTKRFVQRFPEEALRTIREKKLDVLLRFGFGILRGEILTAAKYGIWSYHHGDNDYYRGGPAYFWEILEGNPISGAILQILSEQLDAGKVLYKGIFATRLGVSAAQNRLAPCWGATTFVIQKLRELHEHGPEHLERNSLPPAPYLGKKKLYTMPTNREMLRWLCPTVISKVSKRVTTRRSVLHWRLAVRTGRRKLFDSGSTPAISDFRWIEAPRGRFYADPFLTEEAGRLWVFFEDFDYATSKGLISCAELVGDGLLAEARPALERPHHLSYPCIFRAEGQYYMIPESASNRTIDLYRAVHFPNHWQFEKELFRGPAVDTTVWIEDQRYWFFVTMEEPRGFATQLWLFSADSITGEWSPHPANPILTDARRDRGAGAIFRHNGKLIRPSQDGTVTYGHSFTFNEILQLDRDCYRETPVITVGPESVRNLEGTHTYCHAGEFEIIDGCSRWPLGRVTGTKPAAV
jgi:hypothetical protein